VPLNLKKVKNKYPGSQQIWNKDINPNKNIIKPNKLFKNTQQFPLSIYSRNFIERERILV
jgi:hypothetical protein